MKARVPIISVLMKSYKEKYSGYLKNRKSTKGINQRLRNIVIYHILHFLI
jgi:hypothetical protein